MTERRGLLGYYNYTVILTYVGMLAGFNGLMAAAGGEVRMAIVSLMVAGFCDMFDGAIASTRVRTDAEKCFGIQIDSLSDLICFGVLPAMILRAMFPANRGILAIGALYCLSALIRLAYFNVDEQERQKTSSGSREIYFGLPVTTAALFLPIVYAVAELKAVNCNYAFPAVMALMMLLFLLPFRLKKPKLTGKAAVLACGLVECLLLLLTRGVR